MRIKLLIIFLFTIHQCTAQDEPVYSHYMFNSISFNPSYAGNKERMHLQSSYRMQWIGLEGAPKTFLFSLDAPIYKKMSGGIDITNDKVGDFSFNKIFGNYAYRVDINSISKLSFGIGAGIEMRQFELKDNSIVDLAVLNSNLNKNKLNFKAGVHYSNNQFYIGLSTTSILLHENIYSNNKVVPTRNYFLTSGYLLKIADQWVLYPSCLIKSDFNKYSYFNFTNLVGYKSTIWAGLSYRNGFDIISSIDSKFSNITSRVLGVLIDVELNDQFRIGYNFDYSLSYLSNYENGSHEFSISYYLEGKKSNRMLNPRYL